MITVTERVKDAVRQLAEGRQLSGEVALRLGVAADERHPGQTRLRYVVDLENGAPGPSDHVFGDSELPVIVAQESLAHLDGLELDAQLDHAGARFVFRNPNARHSCRCGQTFMPDDDPAGT
jgi:iron-sulfur cluster assembly protein